MRIITYKAQSVKNDADYFRRLVIKELGKDCYVEVHQPVNIVRFRFPSGLDEKELEKLDKIMKEEIRGRRVEDVG